MSRKCAGDFTFNESGAVRLILRQYVVPPGLQNRGFGRKLGIENNKHDLPHAKRSTTMNNVTENTKVIYVGIDVHKDTNSFCAYDSREDKLFAEHKSSSKFENTLHYLKNLQKSVGQDAVFLIGYEAGPTGYGLCRKLQKEGFACVIIAPSTIAKAPGQKVKTDRMDARLLAKTLAFKTYSPVCLPSEKLEAIKEYTRVRTAKEFFMLTNGTTYQTAQALSLCRSLKTVLVFKFS